MSESSNPPALLRSLTSLDDDDLRHVTGVVERALADHSAAPEVVVTASGLLALEVALMAAGVVPGDLVGCDAFYPFGALAITNVGAMPAPFDLDPASGCPDAAAIDDAYAAGARCMILTPYFGWRQSVSDAAWRAHTRGMTVIEDRAQCFGTHVEPWLAVFSFQAGKLLSSGHGGAIVCPSTSSAEACRRLVNLGWWPRSQAEGPQWTGGWTDRGPGRSARLAPIAAALLGARLPRVGVRQNAIDRCRSVVAAALLEDPPFPALVPKSNGARLLAAIVADRSDRPAVAARLALAGLDSGFPTHPPVTEWPNLRFRWRSGANRLAGTRELLGRLVAVRPGSRERRRWLMPGRGGAGEHHG